MANEEKIVRLKKFDDLLDEYYKSFGIDNYKDRGESDPANFEKYCDDNGI